MEKSKGQEEVPEQLLQKVPEYIPTPIHILESQARQTNQPPAIVVNEIRTSPEDVRVVILPGLRPKTRQ